MKINFKKYHGTGNDFILIDNRESIFDPNQYQLIALMCDRHKGIGADGLILLEKSDKLDFKMVYFNADGHEGSMCGNGGRCVVCFAQDIGIIENKTTFESIDGKHEAILKNNIVSLTMNDVDKVAKYDSHLFLNTGSPHHVLLVDGIGSYPVYEKGREIRYNAPYFDKGTNVNFVEKKSDDSFQVRTYERGVENETLSCGTGVTAVAIAMFEQGETKKTNIKLETLGGQLEVSFNKKNNNYCNIKLKGPAKLVFEGNYFINT